MKKLTIAIGISITLVIVSGIVVLPQFANSKPSIVLENAGSGSGNTTTTVPTVQLLQNKISSSTVPSKLNLRGKIISSGNIRISANVPATVKEILVKRGQNVKKGDNVMSLGGSKEGKHALEIALEQTQFSKQNVETSIQNMNSTTTIAIKQAEQQRNSLSSSITQLQKSLELTRNASNYAIQGATLALNNLQNTITRSQGIRDISGNLADSNLVQAQGLAQLAIQNTARSLLISLEGTIKPLLEGIKNSSNSSAIRSDLTHIQDIIDNLDRYKEISTSHIPNQINEITSILYDLLDTIEDISIDVTNIDAQSAKPLIDAWKQLSGTITSSIAVSVTQLSTTRNQIQNGPINRDLQLASPDSQINASQDQQRVLETAISQAQNAAALQEQSINSQIQNIEQQKLTASLGIEAAKAAAKSQKDALQGQLSIANKQLEQAQIQLTQLTIIAGIDGYIVDVPVSINEDVTIGKELITIYSNRPEFIRLSLNPSDREKVKVGDRLMISLSNDGTEVPATIEKIAEISDTTGTIPIDGIFDNQTTLPAGFVPGSNVQARTNASSATATPDTGINQFVPMSAIVIEKDQSYVWVYQQGKAYKKTVHIGPNQNDQVRILDTIDRNSIIINPSAALQEGQTVALSS